VSVINKMLRDLDQRQAARASSHAQPVGTAQALAGLGTSTVVFEKVPSGGARARRWLWLGLLLVVVIVAVAAGLWLLSSVPTQGSGGTATATAPASAPTVIQPASATSAPAVAPDVSQPVTAVAAPETPGSMVLRMEPSLSARRALDALLSTPAPAPVVATAPAPVQPVPERSKPRPALAAAPAAVASNIPTVVGDSTPVLQRQQQAGGDALAQAQSLWANGSRDAAMDLVQQSITVAERAAKTTGGAGTNPVLLPLVREMARMQLAEARYGAVWEMLTRLEPLLGNQPDLWAIRANAAQRLGRHPDSVHAYMMALQTRPDEQRWLLGTAVSLAALGQTSSAAEMAEKARAQGPVSKDILAYLRQAGVTIRD